MAGTRKRLRKRGIFVFTNIFRGPGLGCEEIACKKRQGSRVCGRRTCWFERARAALFGFRSYVTCMESGSKERVSEQIEKDRFEGFSAAERGRINFVGGIIRQRAGMRVAKNRCAYDMRIMFGGLRAYRERSGKACRVRFGPGAGTFKLFKHGIIFRLDAGAA